MSATLHKVSILWKNMSVIDLRSTFSLLVTLHHFYVHKMSLFILQQRSKQLINVSSSEKIYLISKYSK